jgi:hypothetical protein
MNKSLSCRLGWHMPETHAVEVVAVAGPAVSLLRWEFFGVCSRCHKSLPPPALPNVAVASYRLPGKKKAAI